MSGGIIWMPNNPLMRAEGVADSHEDGLAYLEDVVGDAGPASSPARRETFLTEGYQMLTFLQRKGVQLVRCEGYSDYYPNAKGGNARGRSDSGGERRTPTEGLPGKAARPARPRGGATRRGVRAESPPKEAPPKWLHRRVCSECR